MTDKRLVIAGTASGVGKTTISLGLMAAFARKGYQVQPFKVGPDYIDPGFHSLVTGNNSYNLDSYFLGVDGVKDLYINNKTGSDIAIIEGVMGLFDGKGKEGTSSTAEIAKTLDTPVVLIIDGKKMAQSAAALAYGYKNYDPELKVKGVILNNIASDRHYQILKEKIESKPVNMQVLGYIPRIQELELPERHLGLVPVSESKQLQSFIDKLVQIMERYINLEGIKTLATTSNLVEPEHCTLYNYNQKYNVKIGIAYDEAFNFYYQYNFDLLKQLGAELVYFSPVRDEKLPDVDGIYLGGGFPESFLDQLAANQSMKQSIKNKVMSGMPVYAECGGLMYLSKEIIDLQGTNYPMTGIITATTEMQSSLQEMGYVEVEAVRNNAILNKGEKARGHVFHYSRITDIGEDVDNCYLIKENKSAGYSTGDNILASYVHLHFASNPGLVNNFLHKAELLSGNKK